ncbi:MAG: glycerol-3-phosphate acyltransferase [Trueperaceae bacterium]|nr:glycerol-3-phosphate acyltransferase [Trueperaceae bacterium]
MDLATSSTWAPTAFAALVAFLGGALPFALWVGRLWLRRDVREVGDGNPGATNAFRTGGPALGVAVLMLDVTKGVLPIVLARDALGLSGVSLALVAALPVAGAAFSPFLGFRGGKALAVLLGSWIGLTLWTIPLVGLTAIVIATRYVEPDGWAVVVTLVAMLLGVLMWVPERAVLLTLLAQAGIILWKHRVQLAETPRRRRRGAHPARAAGPPA